MDKCKDRRDGEKWIWADARTAAGRRRSRTAAAAGTPMAPRRIAATVMGSRMSPSISTASVIPARWRSTARLAIPLSFAHIGDFGHLQKFKNIQNNNASLR